MSAGCLSSIPTPSPSPSPVSRLPFQSIPVQSSTVSTLIAIARTIFILSTSKVLLFLSTLLTNPILCRSGPCSTTTLSLGMIFQILILYSCGTGGGMMRCCCIAPTASSSRSPTARRGAIGPSRASSFSSCRDVFRSSVTSASYAVCSRRARVSRRCRAEALARANLRAAAMRAFCARARIHSIVPGCAGGGAWRGAVGGGWWSEWRGGRGGVTRRWGSFGTWREELLLAQILKCRLKTMVWLSKYFSAGSPETAVSCEPSSILQHTII